MKGVIAMKKSCITLLVTLCLLLTTLFVPVQAVVGEPAIDQIGVVQQLPDLYGDEGIGKDVVYTQNVSSDYLQPSEAEAYQIMIGLKSKFPHGMTFTNRHYYAWKGGSSSYYYGGGHGCAGFCFYLSDACFGSTPAERIYNFTYEQIKVGDCLRINNDTHIVTVMEKYDDHIVVAEANYDDMVYWGRTFTRSQVMEITTFLLTRYGKWQQYNGGWKYVFVDGKYAAGWGRIQGKWYYFNNEGFMQTGVLTIGGKKYAFDSNSGAMITGWINHKVDGVTYKMYANNSGEIQSGWVKIDGKWHFFNGNGYMKTGWHQEGSSWYYLDPTSGVMYTGIHTINGASYTFNSSGIWQQNSAKNGWVQENGKWYYYKNNAKQKGWLQEGSTWYYLDSNGVMVTGEYVISGKTHVFNGSGVWQGEKVVAQKNGWVKENSDWFYYKNGVKQTGIQTIGGYKYAFRSSDGAMITGWINHSTGGAKYLLYADGSGVIQTGWKQIGGKWYFFDGNGYMKTGWLQQGSTWYYLDSNGVMVTGEYVISGKTHVFNGSGVWQGEKVVVQKNGWVQESGKWFFYKNDVKQKGWLQQGSTWYYLDSNGVMVTGEYVISGKTHVFNGSGVWQGEKAQKNGWIQESGKWYYYKNDVMQKGIQTIGGVKYAFDSNTGVMITGWINHKTGGVTYKLYAETSGAIVTGFKTISGKTYYFDPDGFLQTGLLAFQNGFYFADDTGAVVKNSWKKYDGDWYYFGSDGKAVTGWFQQSGIWYYMNAGGVMVTGEYEISGKIHVFNNSGVWLGEKTVKNGWVQENGYWYYYQNDKAVVGKQQIGGKWYAFRNDGIMLTGWIDQTLSGGTVNKYYANSDGTLCFGWKQVNGTWYYFDPGSGIMQTGLKTIGGKLYAFTDDGEMLTGWIKDSQGNQYYANTSGVLVVNRWEQIDDAWHHFDANGICTTIY